MYKVSTLQELLDNVSKLESSMSEEEYKTLLNSELTLGEKTLRYCNSGYTGLFVRSKGILGTTPIAELENEG